MCETSTPDGQFARPLTLLAGKGSRVHIAIIGGGWYGCHLASELAKSNVGAVVFERHDELFIEASGVNQSRLHLGFHYPRSHITRMQSIRGFHQFVAAYPTLSGPVRDNLYAVCQRQSLLDFETYRYVMRASALDFTHVHPADYGVRNVEGALLCGERHLKIAEARRLFRERLGTALRLGTAVERVEPDGRGAFMVNGERFSHVIDATWCQLSPAPVPVYYEPAMLLLYQRRDGGTSHAVTIMDGDLYSIYPFDDNGMYTLSGVVETSLGKYNTSREAWGRIASIGPSEIESLRRRMEVGIAWYYPAFCEEYDYVRPIMAVKTKPVVRSDDRACYVKQQGNHFTVLSGKIDTIFEASSLILNALDVCQEAVA